MPRTLPARSLAFAAALALAALAHGSVHAASLQFQTADGLLLVEIEDPAVRVALDGQELRVTGAGAEEIRLATGPDLFPPFAAAARGQAPRQLLTVTRDDRVVLRIVAVRLPTSSDAPRRAAAGRPQEAMLSQVRNLAGDLTAARSQLDQILWKNYGSTWTTTEAAKLLLGFFRGNGALERFTGTPDEQRELVRGLARLRAMRQHAMAILGQIAAADAHQPQSPLVGSWKVVAVHGMGGVAADALELYDPDPVGRTFICANGSAGLSTGGAFWLFDATHDPQGPGTIDLSVVVRGDTVYRGRYDVRGNRASLAINPMNTPRPDRPDGSPQNGGFVLEMERSPLPPHFPIAAPQDATDLRARPFQSP